MIQDLISLDLPITITVQDPQNGSVKLITEIVSGTTLRKDTVMSSEEINFQRAYSHTTGTEACYKFARDDARVLEKDLVFCGFAGLGGMFSFLAYK